MSKLRGIKLQYMSFCLAVFVICSTFFYVSFDSYAYTKAVAGTSKNKNMEYSFSRNQLDDKDWNTTLQGIYVTDLEFDNENNGYSVDVYTNMEGYIDDDESLIGWEDVSVGGWSSGLLDSSSVSSEVRNRNYSSGYYLNAQNSLFTSSPDVYYYKIKIDISNSTYSASQVRWARYVIGTYTDLVNGTAEIGGLVNNLTTINKTVMNDFKSEPIYIGVLVCYYASLSDKTVDGEKNEYKSFASISFSADFDITYTPYYLDEGSGDITDELDEQTDVLKDVNSELNSQTSQMQEQNAELDKQTAQLKEQNKNLGILQNGYDDSAGVSMNEGFSTSLYDYQTSEDSLFASARSGLDDFNLFYFTSIPGLVTGVSFVTATMNSIFEAMGGETGPIGIVLAFLFSVILVSMAVGLYRFFNHQSKGGDD